MALIHRRTLDIYASHRQFYFWDPDSPFAAPEDYTAEDSARRLKAGDHLVAVLPERFESVPVEIEIHDAEPQIEAKDWDHVVECSLHVAGRSITVEECCGSTLAKFTVEPGWYRLRSFHGALGTVKDDQNGNDHYLVVLWPAPADTLRVIRQWTQENTA